MVIFKDRQSAGKLLSSRLQKYKGLRDAIVLAIPRGGVVVAKEVAKSLKLPLDIIVTRKIGAPYQKELALGAVNSDGKVFWEEELLEQTGIRKEELVFEIEAQRDEIKRRELVYRGKKQHPDVKGKTVILVDDGIATGATAMVAIYHLKDHGVKKIVLAVPVIPKDTLRELIDKVSDAEVLYLPERFGSVGQFYQDFQPISDEEVVQLLS